MSCARKLVVDLALEEVGYHEKASRKDLDSKSANIGDKNYTKYAEYIDTLFPKFYNGKKQGFAWCDVFVDSLFLRAYGYENAKRLLCQPDESLGAGCAYSARYYEQSARFSTTPEVGSQVFFLNSDNKISHTGLVVDFNTDSITVVEGNSSDAVVKKTYSITSKSIYGYGIPQYDDEFNGEMEISVDLTEYNSLKINFIT